MKYKEIITTLLMLTLITITITTVSATDTNNLVMDDSMQEEIVLDDSSLNEINESENHTHTSLGDLSDGNGIKYVTYSTTITFNITNATKLSDTNYECPVSTVVRILPIVTASTSTPKVLSSEGTVELFYGSNSKNLTTGRALLLTMSSDEWENYPIYAKYYEYVKSSTRTYAASTSNTLYFNVYVPGKVKLTATGGDEITINPGNSVRFYSSTKPSSASGNVILRLNGTDTETKFAVNGNVYHYFNKPGDYTVTVYYDGNGVYDSSISNEILVHVNKYTPTASLSLSEDRYIGSPVTVTANLPDDATGTVKYYVNNIEKETLNVGESFTYTPTNDDDLNIKIEYSGDNNYKSITYSETITAEQPVGETTTTTLTLSKDEILIGESVDITVNVVSGETPLTGKVNVTIGDDTFELTIGETKTYTPLKNGNLNIVAVYLGDETYAPSRDNKNLKVNKYASSIIIEINSTDVATGEKVLITPTVTPSDATGEIDILINGTSIATINNGETYTFTPTSNEIFGISAIYKGNNKYDNSTSNLISLPVLQGNTISFTINGVTELNANYGASATFSATIENSAGGKAKILCNGKELIEIPISVIGSFSRYLNEGTGDLHYNVYYEGNGQYRPAISNDVIVHISGSETTTEITLDKNTVNVGSNILVTPKVSASSTLTTGIIEYYVNGVKIGEGNVNEDFIISPTETGEYSICGIFLGYGEYESSTSETLVYTVSNPLKTTTLDLTISSLTINVDESVTIKVTLNSEGNKVDGKDIILIIGNETKSATSGYDYTFTPDKVGEYTISAKFLQDSTYESSESESKTLTVNYLNPELSLTLSENSVNLGETVIITPTIKSGLTDSIRLFIDNEEVTPIVNGNNYEYTTTKSGNIEIKAVFEKNDKYEGKTVTKTLTVIPLSSVSLSSNITGNTVYYGDIINLTNIVTPNDATGNVKLLINGVDSGITLNLNDNYDYVVNSIGDLSFKITYDGDGVYAESESETLNFVAEKALTTTSISLTKYSFDVSDEIIVTPSVKNGENTLTTGIIEYYLDTVKIGEKDLSETFTITATNGDHTLYAIYKEGTYYASSQSTKVKYSVGKLETTTTIILSSDNVDVDTPITITINVKHNDNIISGNVDLIIDDESKTVTIGDAVEYTPIKGGTHTIKAVFNGDTTYATSTAETQTLTANKLNPTLSFTLDQTSITEGENVIITPTITNGATGDIEIISNDEIITTITTNTQTYTYTPDETKTYNIKLHYTGDDKYNEITTETQTLKVNPNLLPSTISINVKGETEITTYYDTLINFTTIVNPNTATGKVRFYFDNIEVGGLTDANSWTLLPINKVGDIIVTAKYLGDEIYSESTTTESITIHALPAITKTTITLSTTELNIDETLTITPKVMQNYTEITTGKISYYLNNTKIGEEDISTPFTYQTTESGEFTLFAVYEGDELNGKSNSINSTFTVKKYKTTVFITVGSNEIDVKDSTTITVTVKNGDNEITGEIKLQINDTTTETITIGTPYTFTKTTAGKYEINAIYEGNTRYESSSSKTLITVNKINPTFTISLTKDNIYTNENTIITPTLPTDATGIISIIINNENIKNISTTETFEYTPTNGGTYTITAKYLGDNTYNTKESNTLNLIVTEKTNININTPTKTVHYGDTITLTNTINPTTATGTIQILKNGIDTGITNIPLNGNTTYTFEETGTFKFKGIFTATGFYESSESEEIEITVLPRETTITIELNNNNFALDETLTVTPTVKTGTTTINTGNIEYYIGNVKVDTLPINTPYTTTLTTKGNYEIYAIYIGDTINQQSQSTTSKYSVGKIPTTTTITITKNTINITDTTTITINVQANGKTLTGNAILKINDKTETITIGTPYTFQPTNDGIYNISAEYYGDEDHGVSQSEIETITVNKLETTLTLTTNTTQAKSGDTILITPTITTGTTGTIHILINNITLDTINIGKTYTYTIPNTGGKYNISLKYEGDNNYKPTTSNTITLNIVGTSTISLTANSATELTVNYGDTIRFTNIVTPEDATGTIKLLLNGEDTGITTFYTNNYYDYTIKTGGDLHFTATYPGSSMYLSSQTTQDVIIHVNPINVNLTININKNNITLGETLTITPTIKILNETFTEGTITYYINGTKIEDKTPQETFTYTPEENGEYNITAVFKHTNGFNTINTSQIFTVSDPIVNPPIPTNPTENNTNTTNETNTTKEIYNTTIIANDLTITSQNNIYTITLIDEDKNPVIGKIIIFQFNNNIITSTTDDLGKATINIGNLPDGEYKIEYIFTGDTKYLQSNGTSTIRKETTNTTNPEQNTTTEEHNTTYIITEDVKGVYGENTNYTGQLVDKNGNAIIGQHVLVNITRLSSGAWKVYDVTTDYNGNYYLPINLAPGFYKIESIYNGLHTNNYNYEATKLTESNMIISTEEENRYPIIINATDYQSTYSENTVQNKDFTGTLKTENNTLLIGYHVSLRLIRLKADGTYGASKTYDAVTDYTGKFTLQINLAPGNYKAICSYNGNEIYAQGFDDASITITRA